MRDEEIIKKAEETKAFGCEVHTRSYDFSCQPPVPDTKIIRHPEKLKTFLPAIGETFVIRLPSSNPHYLETVEITRPAYGNVVMFRKEFQSNCSECGAEFEIDGIPAWGVVSTTCPNGCNRGSWLQEFPSGDYHIPQVITFDLKKERRRAEDRLRKMSPNTLFRTLRAIKKIQ